MTEANKTFLDNNRHHYTTLMQAGFMRNLSGQEREGMQRVMSEEFQPGYSTDLWCPPCVTEMVKTLYRNYDNWLAKNTKIVQTGFPSNKD